MTIAGKQDLGALENDRSAVLKTHLELGSEVRKITGRWGKQGTE